MVEGKVRDLRSFDIRFEFESDVPTQTLVVLHLGVGKWFNSVENVNLLDSISLGERCMTVLEQTS